MKGNELKPHIGIFGRCNVGKSTLVNCLTGQQVAIVSPEAGTTTDPVRKTMELGGVGPVVWVDTAGLDDASVLGARRVERSLDVLAQVDLALVLFAAGCFDADERRMVDACRAARTPFVLVHSKSDVVAPDRDLLESLADEYGTRPFCFSASDQSLVPLLLNLIRESLPETSYRHPSLLADVVSAGDTVVLVTPIDTSAPEGRMILPQVQVLRDLMDIHAQALFCQPQELRAALLGLKRPPRLVITDSQAYREVSQEIPDEVFLTSFSVVLARAKGLFDDYVKGAPAIDRLRADDRVLMLESCTHNVTCEDIGRVKLPRLLASYTGVPLRCEAVAGLSDLPRPVGDYALVIQCGGCVVTPKQLASRLKPALQAGVPVTNYGLAIAYMTGIFHRSMRIFNSARQ